MTLNQIWMIISALMPEKTSPFSRKLLKKQIYIKKKKGFKSHETLLKVGFKMAYLGTLWSKDFGNIHGFLKHNGRYNSCDLWKVQLVSKIDKTHVHLIEDDECPF